MLLAEGLEVGEIAAVLGLSISTVRSHLSQVLRRTGKASTLQAVLACMRRGWLSAPALEPEDEVEWRRRLEVLLLTAIRLLERLVEVEPELSSEWREYLAVFGEHLATRHWDRVGLVETRARARGLVEQILKG